MKNNKQLKDLEKVKADQNMQQSQDYKAASQQAPMDQLRQQLGSIEQDIRKQQLDTEASLQDTFSQAAGGLGDSQAISQLQQVVNSLSTLVKNQGLQGAATEYHQLLSQLDQDLRQQIQSGSQDVVRSLQQSVTALVQANSALLDNHTYHQILHYVNQSRLLLTNWESSGQVH